VFAAVWQTGGARAVLREAADPVTADAGPPPV